MDCVTLCTMTATQTLTCRQHIHCPGHQVPQQPLHSTLVGAQVDSCVKLGEHQHHGYIYSSVL